jgi:hypothetical protein
MQQILASSWWGVANGASSSSTKVTPAEHYFWPTNVHPRGHWLPIPNLCRSHSQTIQGPRVGRVPSSSACRRSQEELCWVRCLYYYPFNLGMFLRRSWRLPMLIPCHQRALKSPIAFFKGGDISQLGGDFVLGPGECFFTIYFHAASTICQGITVPSPRGCVGPPIVRLPPFQRPRAC